MTVAFDKVTGGHRAGSGGTTLTISHTPVGTPKAVVVAINQTTVTTDQVSGVTYGGVTMTRVQTNQDTAGEPGKVWLYFLGSSIPTGTQNAVVTLTSNISQQVDAAVITATASRDCEVVDHNGVDENAANPSVTLAYSGRTCMAVGVIHSGLASPPAAGSGTTSAYTFDYGAEGMAVNYQTTPGSSDFAIGFTGSSDDVGFSALAFSEVQLTVSAAGSITSSGSLVRQVQKALAGLFSGQTYAQKVIADGATGYWRFGEGSGTTANDAAHTNNGTYNAGYDLAIAGALTGDSDTAVRFPTGTQTGYVAIASDSNNNAATGTWELWYKRTSAVQHSSALICKGSNMPFLVIDDASLGSVEWYSRGNAVAAHSSTAITDTTTWHHLMCTVDGSGNWKIYLDGTDVTVVDGTPTNTTNATDLNVGRDNAGVPGSFAEAIVDEFAVYAGVVLTGTDAAAHYNLGVNGASGGLAATLSAIFQGGKSISVAGTITSAAALTRQTGKSLSGAITSAGSLARRTAKALAGAITSSSGLTPIKTVLRSFAGTVTSAATLLAEATARVGYYGPGVAMDTLWNDQVGGSANRSVTYRFRAEQTDNLSTVRVYFIGNGNTGYSNGTGGTIRLRLFPDDGSGLPDMSGSALATVSLAPGNPATAFQTFTFGTPYGVTAGTLYHLVFDNTDASPTVNFVSLDGLGLESPVQRPPFNPKFPGDTDWWQGVKDGSGSWSERTNVTPIADIGYAGGAHQGVGWMEISYDAGGAGETGEINGTTKLIREIFTVSGGSKRVTGVGIRMWLVSGTGNVSLRLEDSGGTAIETVTIPATDFPTESNPSIGGVEGTTGQGAYAYTQFTSPHVLADATAYRLQASTDSSTTLRTTVIRKGVDYGMDSATYFGDGSTNRAEKTTDGSSWSSLGRVSNENDIQFYFTTGGATLSLTGAITSAATLARKTAKSMAGAVTSSAALTVIKSALLAIAGAVTSSGSLARTPGKALAGAITSAGSLARRTAKGFAGTVTSAATVAATKVAIRSFAGTVSSAASLARQPGKALAGSVTSASTLVRQSTKSFAGSVASSGAFSEIKALLRSFAGTITSSGSVTRSVAKSMAGSVTSSATLVRQAGKALAGAITSSATLSAIRPGNNFSKSFAGTITSSASLTRQTAKALAGAVASSATLARQVALPLAGAVTSAGSLAKRTAKSMAGSVASAGALSNIKAVLRSFAGTVTSSGALGRSTARAFAGTVGASAGLVRRVATTMAGSVGSSGAATTALAAVRSFAGAIGSGGAFQKQARSTFSGTVASGGTLARLTAKALSAALASAGGLATSIPGVLTIAVGGSLGMAGSFVRSKLRQVLTIVSRSSGSTSGRSRGSTDSRS